MFSIIRFYLRRQHAFLTSLVFIRNIGDHVTIFNVLNIHQKNNVIHLNFCYNVKESTNADDELLHLQIILQIF